MSEQDLNMLGSTLWGIANNLRGTMNASDHFDIGKRQNQLLSEHIKKIIDTHQYRE